MDDQYPGMPSLFLFHSLDSIYYFMIQLYPHTILIILYYIVGEFRGILVRCQSKDRPAVHQAINIGQRSILVSVVGFLLLTILLLPAVVVVGTEQ